MNTSEKMIPFWGTMGEMRDLYELAGKAGLLDIERRLQLVVEKGKVRDMPKYPCTPSEYFTNMARAEGKL